MSACVDRRMERGRKRLSEWIDGNDKWIGKRMDRWMEIWTDGRTDNRTEQKDERMKVKIKWRIKAGEVEGQHNRWTEGSVSGGTSPVVQWLRLCTPITGAWVRSLVRGLWSHRQRGKAREEKISEKTEEWKERDRGGLVLAAHRWMTRWKQRQRYRYDSLMEDEWTEWTNLIFKVCFPRGFPNLRTYDCSMF